MCHNQHDNRHQEHSWLETEKRYRVSVTRHGKTFSERTDTLEEAIECKKDWFVEAENILGKGYI